MSENKEKKEELVTHEAIAEKFQELRSQASQISGRLHDLSAESAEHDAVIKALEKLQPERKCFRLVGEVLVERTVQEVLPAVRGNKEQLEMFEGKLKEQLDKKRNELTLFQEKYKIRLRSTSELQEQSKPVEEGSRAQGVLV